MSPYTYVRLMNIHAQIQPKFLILWPDERYVGGEQLIVWASDDVDNELHAGPKPTTVTDAIEILKETGTVTFGNLK